MKTVFNQICSVIMTVVVMCSTISMTVNKHYCSNILIDTAVFKVAQTCSMHGEQTPTKHKHENERDDCCDDEVDLIEGQDQLKIQSSDFELPHPIFVEAFVFTFYSTTSYETEVNTTIYEDPPPLLARQILALNQTYLI